MHVSPEMTPLSLFQKYELLLLVRRHAPSSQLLQDFVTTIGSSSKAGQELANLLVDMDATICRRSLLETLRTLGISEREFSDRVSRHSFFPRQVTFVEQCTKAFGAENPEVQEIWIEAAPSRREIRIFVQCWDTQHAPRIEQLLRESALLKALEAIEIVDSYQLAVVPRQQGHHYDGWIAWTSPNTRHAYNHPKNHPPASSGESLSDAQF